MEISAFAGAPRRTPQPTLPSPTHNVRGGGAAGGGHNGAGRGGPGGKGAAWNTKFTRHDGAEEIAMVGATTGT